MNADLVSVLRNLYQSEINVEIASFWDGGWNVKIGDHMNGYEAERTFGNDDLANAASWLKGEAIKAYPESDFAKKVAVSR